ncbi:MAG TPA: hypothetical protein VEC01_08260 [Noviherbaspirillum sp.]|uniref:hypothetical protein n=1 Tax=Noviherbaspirillum sp. TaxID=1926288 RepID=UPI002D3C1B3C|nr:hypothetical protein [Noviherbaspirillum sp.]HYD95304.1 hypothetical protein [Noviherbaspirillum sp.]
MNIDLVAGLSGEYAEGNVCRGRKECGKSWSMTCNAATSWYDGKSSATFKNDKFLEEKSSRPERRTAAAPGRTARLSSDSCDLINRTFHVLMRLTISKAFAALCQLSNGNAIHASR